MVTETAYPPGVGNLQSVKFPTYLRSIHTTTTPLSRTTMMSPSRELPMPNISKISTLNQANATLLHCWTKLSKSAQSYSPTASSPSTINDERRYFQHWLEQWELAFTDFLSNAMASMSNDDVTQSRILKTNHLACTILASDANLSSYEVFEAEFRAIIELAGAVLRSRHHSDSPQDKKSTDFQSNNGGLDVKEPLYVVLVRCNQPDLRNGANELLSRFYQ